MHRAPRKGPWRSRLRAGGWGSWRAWLKVLRPSGGPGVTQKRPSHAPCPCGEPHPPGSPHPLLLVRPSGPAPAQHPLLFPQAWPRAALQSSASSTQTSLPPLRGLVVSGPPTCPSPRPAPEGPLRSHGEATGHRARAGSGTGPAIWVCLSRDGAPGEGAPGPELSMEAWFAAMGVDSGIFEIPGAGNSQVQTISRPCGHDS